MFSHIFMSVSDFDRALNFYRPVMDSLGVEMRFCEPDKPWAGWHSADGERPFFVICKPYDGQPQARWLGSQLLPGPLFGRRIRSPWQTAAPAKACRGFARNTMPITMAPTFGTRMGTSSALLAIPRHSTAHDTLNKDSKRPGRSFILTAE